MTLRKISATKSEAADVNSYGKEKPKKSAMRCVKARPRLDEAGVVVVAAGRQDMRISSRTLDPRQVPAEHNLEDTYIGTVRPH